MKDGNIPPSHIKFRSRDLPFAEEMNFLEAEANFSKYLTKSKEQAAKERKNAENDARQQESKIKSSRSFRELQEDMQLEADLEKAQLEEEQEVLSEFEKAEEKAEEKAGKKGKGRGFIKQSSKEEEMQLIQDNQVVNEEGDEIDVPAEEDPLQAMKKEVGAEEEIFDDVIQESSEDIEEPGSLDGEAPKGEEVKEKKEAAATKKESKQIKKKESRRGKLQEGAKKKAANPLKTEEPAQSEAQAIAANANMNMDVGKNEVGKSSQASKARAVNLKPKGLKDLEALAIEIINEAKVLEDGDTIETKVTLNLKDSAFDKGEVTVTAYKYRPLEVNLKFKKFNHEATQLLKKNAKELKKVLKRKSLKVHQLEITEE